MKTKIISVILAAIMVIGSLTGCGKGTNASGDTITIKLFSNLPDRKNGQGLVEQMIIDEYMNENKNVVIEVEALDEEAYKTKFKAYSMEGINDCGPSAFKTKIESEIQSVSNGSITVDEFLSKLGESCK